MDGRMVLKSLFKGSVRQSVFEIFLIVIGVLLALWVDDWRAKLVERKSVQEHLIGIKEEIDGNRWSLHIIRDRELPEQIGALEEVIHVLSQPDTQIDDPESFIRTLMRSAQSPAPWLTQSSFDSFRTSEDFHSDYIPGLARDLAATYEAPNVLFYRRFAHNDAYADVISKLVPARYQSAHNEMRGYVPSEFASPIIADEESAAQAIAIIINDRTEIVRLARAKAKRLTGKWYALTRIIWGFERSQARVLEHPLMKDAVFPDSEIARELEEMKL
jgi:hypothetical protein